MNILKKGGYFSFISSNMFIRAKYGLNLRKFILKNHFIKYFDYTVGSIFEDAKVDPCILVLKKDIPTDNTKILVNEKFEINQNRFEEEDWIFEDPLILNLIDKINFEGIKFKEIEDLKIYRGILTGFNKAFNIDETTKNHLIKVDYKNKEIINPLIRGKDIKKWNILNSGLYLITTYGGIPIDNYPAIKDHLTKYKENLINRNDKGKYWWELRSCDYYSKFDKEKLLFPGISTKLYATYDDKKLYPNNSAYFIVSENTNLKYLSALISSNTLNFIFKYSGVPLARTSSNPFEKPRYHIYKNYLEKLPIILIPEEEQVDIIKNVDEILKVNSELSSEINGFKNWLKTTFEIEKFSQKLDKYYELSYNEFLAELKKKKIDTKRRKVQELLKKEFEESTSKINPLIQEIGKTDKKINQMVYDLYGLVDEEIKIIEESLDG